MFNFSLKNLYDDKVAGYLFLIDLCKWGSFVAIALGIFLACWFSHYWFAILGGILLVIIGCVVALIAHFVKKKLAVLMAMGSNLVEGAENYVKNQAKQQANKIINKK